MKSSDKKITDIELLKMIYRYVSAFGWAPSVQDIIDKTQLSSKSSVTSRLDKLEDFGLIKRGHNQSRALCLTGKGRLLVTGELDA